MLALLSVIVFVLAVFEVDVNGINLIALGLALLAAHHAVGDRVPSLGRRSTV